MLRVLALVISIALADAINPGTVAPALYLATTEHARKRLVEFAGAFLVVNFAGGVLIALGPGQLVLAAVPDPSTTAKSVVELVAGVVLLGIGAVLLALHRGPTESKAAPFSLGKRGAGALGATIASVELPTALPYFAGIAVIVGSGVGVVSQILLLAVFNVVFISPVVAILIMVSFAGPGTQARLGRTGDWLRAKWRPLFAWLAVIAGVLLAGFGLTGLAGLR